MAKKRTRKAVPGNALPTHAAKTREYLLGLLLVAGFFALLFSFSSNITGKAVLGLENATENTTEGGIVAQFRAAGVKPKLVIGYYLDAADIEKMNSTRFVPFLKISCTKDMCVKGVFYECKDGTPQKVQQCKYGCDEKGCKECVEWKEFETGGKVAPRIKGSPNKCVGQDLYRCVGGRWEFTLACPNGCVTTPIKTRNTVENRKEADERKKEATDVKNSLLGRPPRIYEARWGEQFAENYTLGHCRCFYGFDNICFKDDLYQCLGYKDEYFYTNIERCQFGCDQLGDRCSRRKLTCDPKQEKEQCVGGTKWACVDSFWINTKEWCSITEEYKEDLQNPKKK